MRRMFTVRQAARLARGHYVPEIQIWMLQLGVTDFNNILRWRECQAALIDQHPEFAPLRDDSKYIDPEAFKLWIGDYIANHDGDAVWVGLISDNQAALATTS